MIQLEKKNHTVAAWNTTIHKSLGSGMYKEHMKHCLELDSLGDHREKTLSTGLGHPSSNHCQGLKKPIGMEKNCQLMDNFSLVLKWQQVCNRQLKLYQDFFFFYNCPPCLHQQKQKHLYWDGIFYLFLPRANMPHVYVHALTLCCFQSY